MFLGTKQYLMCNLASISILLSIIALQVSKFFMVAEKNILENEPNVILKGEIFL